MIKKFYIKKQFFVQSKETKIKDHYEISEIIGKGAFATVYKSKMKYFPYSTRAIKRIKKKYIKNPSDILNEYTVLTSLDHPQIIKIYETFEDEENFFMVLDYCEGGELFQRLAQEGNFAETDARNIFIQMINIIKYAHDNKVSHRDLKPENFLLSGKQSLDVMLIDFGLCFRWKDNMKKEILAKQGKNLIGTAYYMSPEIFLGHYDERCDIWSLGIILFMLVTGEPPVAGSTSNEILANIRDGKLNFEVLKKKDLNPKLINLVLRILVNQGKRLTIKQIYEHPWITMQIPAKKLNINFQKIRNYSKLSKFKVLVLNYIASQLPQREIMVLGKVFMDIDKNKDGYLTVQELSSYMQVQSKKPEFEDIKSIIEHMDVDHNGKLAYNQFISACLSKSAANNLNYLKYAFQNFDLNHDGKISREELSIILNAYKKQYSQNSKLIDKMIEESDSNKDDMIDFQQFCSYLQKERNNELEQQ